MSRPTDGGPDHALGALKVIAAGMGNLTLDEMGPDGVRGINDGRSRAIYLEAFVKLARETLAELQKEQP